MDLLVLAFLLPLLALEGAHCSEQASAHDQDTIDNAVHRVLAEHTIDQLAASTPRLLYSYAAAKLPSPVASGSMEEALQQLYAHTVNGLSKKDELVERDALKCYRKLRSWHPKADGLLRVSDLITEIGSAMSEELHYAVADDKADAIRDRVQELVHLTAKDEQLVRRIDIESTAQRFLRAKAKDKGLTLAAFLLKHGLNASKYIDGYEAAVDAAVRRRLDIPSAAAVYFDVLTENGKSLKVDELLRMPEQDRGMRLLAFVTEKRPEETMDVVFEIAFGVQKLLDAKKDDEKRAKQLKQAMLVALKDALQRDEQLLSAKADRDALQFIDDVVAQQRYDAKELLLVKGMRRELRDAIVADEEPIIEDAAKKCFDDMLKHASRWTWYEEDEKASYLDAFVAKHSPAATEAYHAKLKAKVQQRVLGLAEHPASFSTHELEQIDQQAKHVYDTWHDPNNVLKMSIVDIDNYINSFVPLAEPGERARLVRSAARLQGKRMLEGRFKMLKACDGKDATTPFIPTISTLPLTVDSDAHKVVDGLLKTLHHPPMTNQCTEQVRPYLVKLVMEAIFAQRLARDPASIMSQANKDGEELYRDMVSKGSDLADRFVRANFPDSPLIYRKLVKTQAYNHWQSAQHHV